MLLNGGPLNRGAKHTTANCVACSQVDHRDKSKKSESITNRFRNVNSAVMSQPDCDTHFDHWAYPFYILHLKGRSKHLCG